MPSTPNIHNDKRLINVEKAMKQAENLMNDFAWNGEEAAYKRMKRRYEHYRGLFMDGILYEPAF